MLRPPPDPPLFPYTTLFRSNRADVAAIAANRIWNGRIINRSRRASLIFASRSVGRANWTYVLALIDCRAPLKRCMGQSRTAIVLERAEHWIGIDLIACRREEPAEVIAAQVVAARANYADAK